ncbi:hypothetical protein [Acinetobacter bereziniae]|uniref:hypothetical protein n=1 Tax=Acinetobacter bereziniae TaxID=106648 RepID=UPI0030168499
MEINKEILNEIERFEQCGTHLDVENFISNLREILGRATPEGFVLELEKGRFIQYELIDLLTRSLNSSKVLKTSTNWVHVVKMLNVGSTVAHRICEKLGVDPDCTKFEPQEQTAFKIGDLVEPRDYRYILASGACRYPFAFVVNINPFQLMSEEGDMYWRCTVEPEGYRVVDSSHTLPEKVIKRMIREGLINSNKAQEQSHD